VESFLSDLVLSNKWAFRLGRHFLFWTLAVFFFATIYGGFGNYSGYSLKNTFTEAVIFLPAHMFLSYSIIYFLLPRYLFTGKYMHLVFGIFILILMTALLSTFISRWVLVPYRDARGLDGPSQLFFHGFLAGLRGSNTVAGFVAAIKLVKYWYFKKEENSMLEKEKLKSELAVLKGQVHPHFLFNTLNNLYSIILQQSKDAPEMVLKLSALLRYVLTECQQGTVNLTKELAILSHYVSLEQMRFGDRLDLSFHVDGELDQKTIAPLLLLPLVENSFKHGANEMLEQPWITISISVTGNQLKCRIINGKPLRQPGVPFSTGTGLQNLRKRLVLLYPNRHDLRTTNNGENFTANLTLEMDECHSS
jgi:sensor histidine kinase YesM